MEKQSYFKILAEKQLIIMCLTGKIDADDVISFLNSLISDKYYDPKFNSLIDLRNSEMSYKIEDIRSVFNHMSNIPGFAAKRKTVYVTSNSSQVVPPLALTTKNMNLPMEIKVTSELQSAFKYLDLNQETSDLIESFLPESC